MSSYPADDLYPSDQYGFASLLSDDERAVLARLRRVLDEQARPLLADYWERGEFPLQLVEPLVALRLMDPPELTRDGAVPSALYSGFRNFELARTDASLATFYNAQSGLFRTTINQGGSAEQAARWDPEVRSFDLTGVLALTEPDHGSDIAGGLATSARRDGDDWVITGAKRWIGGASSARFLAVFARDECDAQVKAFLMPTDAPGVTITKIGRKTALRMMQNADIELDGVRVGDEFRLANINGFSDVAALLRRMRSDVAWIATGVQAGAYEARFHADAEAVYSYEGTHEINALIVGRAITGVGAFR